MMNYVVHTPVLNIDNWHWLLAFFLNRNLIFPNIQKGQESLVTSHGSSVISNTTIYNIYIIIGICNWFVYADLVLWC